MNNNRAFVLGRFNGNFDRISFQTSNSFTISLHRKIMSKYILILNGHRLRIIVSFEVYEIIIAFKKAAK